MTPKSQTAPSPSHVASPAGSAASGSAAPLHRPEGSRRTAREVLAGLRATPKRLPCKLFYDARGAELFERICTLDAYYPTRTELALLDQHLAEVAYVVGPLARVIEPGSGAGEKTRRLLAALEAPAVYVPIDVSREQLERTAMRLRARFAGLEVRPLHADYTTPLVLPLTQRAWRRTLVFFPGSTIGNFEPDEAVAFLARLASVAGDDALLLLGTDTTSDSSALLRAYDDEEGVTAAFDLNVLAHLNREYGASFDLDAFVHRAVWNEAASRIEMHLVSQRAQTVTIAGASVHFDEGEAVVTEHCYKHSPAAIEAILAEAGWRVQESYVGAPFPMTLWLGSSMGAPVQRV